jgi:outer membrane murein-binding lipoprotein Lpp
MNDWRTIDWKSFFDLPMVSMVVRNIEERRWLVKIIEYVAVAAVTATVILYGSDTRQSNQIDTLKDNQKTLQDEIKEMKADVAQMRHDLYVPRSITNKEIITEKHNELNVPRR